MNRIQTKDHEDILVVAVVIGKERFIVMFREDTRAEAMRSLGRWASDERLSFTWYDAAVASRKIREQKND